MLETAIKEKVLQIASRLASADIGSIRIDIEVSGRTEAGDILIRYKVGDSYGAQADAYALDPAVDEFLRRKVWNDANAPRAITHQKEDEIVF